MEEKKEEKKENHGNFCWISRLQIVWSCLVSSRVAPFTRLYHPVDTLNLLGRTKAGHARPLSLKKTWACLGDLFKYVLST